jgi:hypothetical protein
VPKALRQSLFPEIPTEFSITGSSMAPQFVQGDTVLLKPYDDQPLLAGRCYAYKDGPALVFHRYVATHGEFALFLGDNALAPQFIHLDNIVGRPYDETLAAADRWINFINSLFLRLFHVRRWLINSLQWRRRSKNEKEI